MNEPVTDELRQANPLFAAWALYALPYLIDLGKPEIFSYHQIRDQFAGLRAFRLRRRAVLRWSWAIPSQEALATIAKYAPIVEIGAGRGYWATLLRRDFNVIIRAYDRRVPPGRFGPVLQGTARKAKQFPTHTLFLCWPPYWNDMALQALRKYQGQHVIYVGDPTEDAQQQTNSTMNLILDGPRSNV